MSNRSPEQVRHEAFVTAVNLLYGATNQVAQVQTRLTKYYREELGDRDTTLGGGKDVSKPIDRRLIQRWIEGERPVPQWAVDALLQETIRAKSAAESAERKMRKLLGYEDKLIASPRDVVMRTFAKANAAPAVAPRDLEVAHLARSTEATRARTSRVY